MTDTTDLAALEAAATPGPWHRRSDARQRFWAKVRYGGTTPATADCWEWKGASDGRGYGVFHVPGTKQATIKAPRAAWLLWHGELDGDLSVLHRCDNPPCVRPEHLFLGTQQDNMDDAVAKGRAANQHTRALKVTCPRGHPYAIYGRWHGRSRYCRECQRLRYHERKAVR